jgi:anthranilate 1,2-dioxygenase small subunit
MVSYLEHCRAIDELLGLYALVVDGQEWERWPELFAEDCYYAVVSIENVEQDLPLAYMLDDSRGRILDRVKFVREVWAGTVEPYRTRHSIQRTMTMDLGSGVYEVQANFLVGYTLGDGTAGMLAMGHYEDQIAVGEEGALFLRKVVYLDNVPPRYLIYPL